MNTKLSVSFGDLADSEILAQIHSAVIEERSATARVIGLLMEIDVRRLYLAEGCSSLFTYCTQVLHLSEHAAYNRIETARAARCFPVIRHLIETGAITLTTARLLAPHLTDANHRDVLERARHKHKRDIELLIATLKPQPDVPSTVRKLPNRAVTLALPTPSAQPEPAPAGATSGAEPTTAPALRPSEIKPLTPERDKVQFTVSRETHDQLRRAQDLLRHTVPNGDPAVIFERALRLLVADLERARTGKASRPRAAGSAKNGSRLIPAVVKRTVWQRDAGRCAFTGTRGRCTEPAFSNFITWCRSRTVARRRRTTSSCDVVRTTNMKRMRGLAQDSRQSRGKRAPHSAEHVKPISPPRSRTKKYTLIIAAHRRAGVAGDGHSSPPRTDLPRG